MSYKQTFYFIARCLTISLDQKNKTAIEKTLQANTIDWAAVVQVSTQQLVFPALYCALKREGFLHSLPQDLVNYMEHITGLNRKRNQQIISQVRALNTFLLEHGITPIFLKGAANLIAGLYTDIAERMVGDIDFIFSKQDYPKAIGLLREYGYSEVLKAKYYFPNQHHYRRLHKKGHIAAIEIHKAYTLEKYNTEFNYTLTQKNSQVINGVQVLGYADALKLSIITNQITDHGYRYTTIPLRNAYDVLLLSNKTNALQAVNKLNKLKKPLLCFLAGCYEVFNSPECLNYRNNKQTTRYLKELNHQFSHPEKTRKKHKRIKWYIDTRLFLYTLYRCIFYKQYTIWLLHRIRDRNWYQEKFSFFVPNNNS